MAVVGRARVRAAARAGVRGLGVLLLWAGGTVLLYLAWLLWFTGIGTAQAQDHLLDQFVGFGDATGTGAEAPTALGRDPVERDQPGRARSSEVVVGTGVAVLEFERPASSAPPVRDEPVVVVEGTTEAALREGPGHYVASTGPGEQGNFAVAGHRTTYGQPFHDLDQVRPGDLVHVTTRDGTRHSYRVLDDSSGGAPSGQHVISPNDTWVLGDDPLGTGGAVLTLTTCHPRFSAAYRLVVFARLVETVPA